MQSAPAITAATNARDICRVLSTALLADGDLDEPELRAIESLDIERILGIPPQQFRAILHEVCRELMLDDDGSAGLSLLEPARIHTALHALNDPQQRFGSTAQLIAAMQEGDPVQLRCKLLDSSRLDAALDRIVDPELRLCTCAALMHFINADGELHRDELFVFEHILARWNLTLGVLSERLMQASPGGALRHSRASLGTA